MSAQSQRCYAIDYAWHEDHDRSLAALVRARLCSACRSDNFASSDDPLALMATIAECCSHDRGFITPYTPTREAIFRVLLGHRNEPLTAAEVCGELQQRLGSSLRIAMLTQATVERLLEHDTYYGIRPVAEAQPQPEAA